MRILLGGLTHEANTFCPHAAELSDFDSRQVMRGEQMLENWQQTRTEQAGALSIFSRTPDCVVVPTFLARGLSAGPIQDETYTVLRDELLASLEAALPADGVLLVLHGAMMAENEPDATGDVLQRVRALVGTGRPGRRHTRPARQCHPAHGRPGHGPDRLPHRASRRHVRNRPHGRRDACTLRAA